MSDNQLPPRYCLQCGKRIPVDGGEYARFNEFFCAATCAEEWAISKALLTYRPIDKDPKP